MEDKILLVDDEEGIRKVLSITLSDAGYTVFTAESGDAALEIFRKEAPPLVLTDIKMPGMDGVALLRNIKRENPDTEVIMITGHGDMDLAIRSLKSEATDFITKPINDDILGIAVEKARERIITREKLREYTESLEALVREKSALQDRLSSLGLRISSISHGIKGMMTGLDGGIYLVDTGFAKENKEQIREGWDIVKQIVSQVRQMVLDILYYTKERDLEWASVALSRFCQDVIGVVEKKARDRQIDIRLDLDPELDRIELDAGYFRSALINILENAIDACTKMDTGTSHRIDFRVGASGSTVRFEIADTGIGMDADSRDRIFDLFYSSKGREGTGLGLYIAKKVIQQHGGTISVKSKPGQGTCFTIELPKKLPDSVKSPPPDG